VGAVVDDLTKGRHVVALQHVVATEQELGVVARTLIKVGSDQHLIGLGPPLAKLGLKLREREQIRGLERVTHHGHAVHLVHRYLRQPVQRAVVVAGTGYNQQGQLVLAPLIGPAAAAFLVLRTGVAGQRLGLGYVSVRFNAVTGSTENLRLLGSVGVVQAIERQTSHALGRADDSELKDARVCTESNGLTTGRNVEHAGRVGLEPRVASAAKGGVVAAGLFRGNSELLVGACKD
jgi:hypothetical protein